MPPIELLGEEWEIGASHESKWRSFLDPRETPWLLKHRLNGVAVLPGAAYVVMATTAARRIFRDEAIVMIDIQNIRFDLPLVFPDENTAVETVLTIVKIEKTQHDAHAEFYVDFCSHPRNDELMTAVRGQIHVRFGFDADRTSPEILPHPSGLTTVNRDYFYKALFEAGYGYSGPFKAVRSIQRRIDFATGEIAAPHSDLIIHPAALDGLFQASFAAESYPADSAMPNFRVPTCIRSIKIFPTRCQESFASTGMDEIATPAASAKQPATSAPTACTRGRPSTVLVGFDVHRTSFYEYAGAMRSASDVGVFCQIEGLVTVPFRLSTADDDLTMFREVAWISEYPDHVLRNEELLDAHTQDVDLALACERVAFYYLRKLLDDVPPQSAQQASSAVHGLIDFARLTVVEVTLGEHPTIQQAWLSDDMRTVHAINKQYPDSVDLQLTKLMGAAYPSIIRGMDTAVNVLFRDGDLSQFYRKGIGFPETNQILASFVSALTNQLPNSHILEVGAGTGASTEAILAVTPCSHYMFTDVSSAFFDPAKETLRRYQNSVSFKTFDMEMNPLEQGFPPESFDNVVASNVLHATSDVRMVLRNVRSLIRPGGHLVCVELADGCLLRNTVIMGGLPGWWLGHKKDRFWTPALSEHQWDVYLKASGFSGLDCITPAAQPTKRPYRVFSTQAVDQRVQLLRSPLQHCAVDQSREPLLVI
jgi:SAM-dependent methyltransferase